MADKQRLRRKAFPNNNHKPSSLSMFGRRTNDGLSDMPAETPKILLKPKSSTPALATPTISVATRPERPASIGRPATGASSSSEPSSAVRLATKQTAVHPNEPAVSKSPAIATGESARETPPDAQAAASAAPDRSAGAQRMTHSVALINEHLEIEPAALVEHLLDGNGAFCVIGAIGTQSAGKSTLLNMLDGSHEPGKYTCAEYFIRQHSGQFQTRRAHPGAEPVTQGIRMHVLRNRVILLDCAPLLCNPGAKDVALSDLDDMRLAAFMLAVCQKLLVVDSAPVNMALVRLLCMAEMLKPSVELTGEKIAEQLQVDQAHYPVLLFVHNMAEQRHFRVEHRRRMNRVYAALFRDSNLRVFNGAQTAGELDVADDKDQLNLMVLPRVTFGGADGECAAQPIGWPAADWTTLTAQLRHWVAMEMPVRRFGPDFTEKCWSQLVHFVWDSRMYRDLMRKFNAEQLAKCCSNNTTT